MGGAIEASGGSAANTISGIASFGGKAAYIGRVFDDQLGAVFAHDLRATGAVFRCAPATEGPPTGRCLIVVTPDAERTMNTYLGVVGVPRARRTSTATSSPPPRSPTSRATCSTGPRPRRPTGRRAASPTTPAGA